MKRWPLNKAYFWETAPFFRILVPFVAGIICYDHTGASSFPVNYSFIIIVASFLLLCAIVYIKQRNGLRNTLTFLLLNCFLFFSGLSISWFSDIRNDKTWLGKNIDASIPYLARINDAPAEKENSWKVPVTLLSKIEDGKAMPVKGDAFLYLLKTAPMQMHKGDSIIISGKWQPIKNAGNPFEFDYATYCRRNNIVYQQVSSTGDIRLYGANNPAREPFIDRAHDWCMLQLDKYLTDTKTKGLIQAMLLGDEVNLDEDLRQSYSETGIVHIIAISGGNVAIFFFVISSLLWWLKNKRHLWIKYTIALPLVWFYVLMAGAAPSAIRAAMMFSLLAFGIMLQKNNNSLNQLFATAFLLLCVQPMWLFSVGFQLSFVAVLSLILFYAPVYKWVSPVNKITQVLWATVAASISAEILVAPLVIYYFHTFPLLFIVANVAAYLFMSAVLVAGIAIIFLSFIPAVAALIGVCTEWVVTVFDKIVVWLQSLNPESFHFLVLTAAELVVVYIIITGMALFFSRKQKQALFVGLGAFCLLLLLSCDDEWANLHQQRLVVYNTGKTNHIELIEGNRFSVLYTDTSKNKRIAYAVKPAHTYWQAFRQNDVAPNEIVDIHGKSVLVLKEPMTTGGKFPVDYLVVNSQQGMDAATLKKIFSPSLIIIGNTLPPHQKSRFIQDCMEAGIAVYDVSKNGAFIVN